MAIETTKILALGHRGRQWRARLGPIDVIRPTRAEAVDALTDTIEDMISGSYEPAILTFGRYVTVVYRDTNGWCYRVERTPVDQGRPFATCSLGRATRTEAIRLARRHMVQMAYPGSDTSGLRYLESAGDLDGVLDHARWLGFQRAYATVKQYAEAAGTPLSESDLHRIACEKAGDPLLMGPDERSIVERSRQRIAEGG